MITFRFQVLPTIKMQLYRCSRGRAAASGVVLSWLAQKAFWWQLGIVNHRCP